MLGEDSGEGKSRKRVKRKGKSDLIDRMLSSYRKKASKEVAEGCWIAQIIGKDSNK